jgi:hypothetical protein
VILDTKGNVFGGFTPVKWESRTESPWTKEDDSLKSFLFTLRNPHNMPARKFALKPEEKYAAIGCSAMYGPWFGGSVVELIIGDACNKAHPNVTQLGHSYVNDTGLHERIVFTGVCEFNVEEIEVFEITA